MTVSQGDTQTDQQAFQGIFYGPMTGSDRVMAERGEFLQYLLPRPDAFFLAMVAIVDTRYVVDMQPLADELLAKAKELWLTEDWGARELQLSQLGDMITAGTPMDVVYSFANSAFMPLTGQVPTDFNPYSLGSAPFTLVFADPVMTIGHAVMMESWVTIHKIVIILTLNNCEEKKAEVVAAINDFVPNFDLGLVNYLVQQIREGDIGETFDERYNLIMELLEMLFSHPPQEELSDKNIVVITV